MVESATAASASAAANKTQKGLAGNFDTFLKLLTTQLKNQNPLSPMESEKFTEQLVQFTGVEQQIETNKQLAELIKMTRNSEASAALNYLGKEVVVAGSTLRLADEGNLSGSYKLAANAAEVKVEIRDSRGKLIRTLDAERVAGTHKFDWDGKDDNGKRVAAGAYTLKVTATDKAGNDIKSSVLSSGRVTGVENTDNGLSLMINGVATPLKDIRSIKQTADA